MERDGGIFCSNEAILRGPQELQDRGLIRSLGLSAPPQPPRGRGAGEAPVAAEIVSHAYVMKPRRSLKRWGSGLASASRCWGAVRLERRGRSAPPAHLVLGTYRVGPFICTSGSKKDTFLGSMSLSNELSNLGDGV